MRLGDYRDKTSVAEDARKSLAALTASMERNRGLYGHDVWPAPHFRSGRKAYEAETERMAGRLGLLGKVGTAQATLGAAGERARGWIGSAREGKLGTIGAARLGAEADIFGYKTGAKKDVAVERLRGRSAVDVAGITAEAGTRKAISKLLAEGDYEGIVGLLTGQAPGGEEGLRGKSLEDLYRERDALSGAGAERTPEEEVEDVEAVRRYFPDETSSLFEIKQAARGRLGIIPARIRRARELSEKLRTW